MSQDEIAAIMKSKYDSDKILWEQTRLKCFYTVVSQVGTKDIKSPKDLFTLAWDDNEVDSAKYLTKDEFMAVANNLIKQ